MLSQLDKSTKHRVQLGSDNCNVQTLLSFFDEALVKTRVHASEAHLMKSIYVSPLLAVSLHRTVINSGCVCRPSRRTSAWTTWSAPPSTSTSRSPTGKGAAAWSPPPPSRLAASTWSCGSSAPSVCLQTLQNVGIIINAFLHSRHLTPGRPQGAKEEGQQGGEAVRHAAFRQGGSKWMLSC